MGTLERRRSRWASPPWSLLTRTATSNGLELLSMGGMGLPSPPPRTGCSSTRSGTSSATLLQGRRTRHQDQEPQENQRQQQEGQRPQQGGQRPRQGDQGRREGRPLQGGQGQQGHQRGHRGDQRFPGGQTPGNQERNRAPRFSRSCQHPGRGDPGANSSISIFKTKKSKL